MTASPDALNPNLPNEAPASVAGPFSVVPSASSTPSFRTNTPLTPLVCDERAIQRLLETLVSRSGKSISLIAELLGVSDNAVRQYIRGRRTRPSLIWVVRLAEVCGAKLSIEFPKR